MKAIYFEQHGNQEVLQYGDLPQPTPKSGEALIRVKAVALNRLDIWVREGWKGLHLNLPHIGGSDIVGELISLNNAKTQLRVGDRVIVNPGVSTTEDEWTRKGLDSVSPGYRIIGEHTPGGMAEYITVPIDNIYKMSEGSSPEKAAATLLTGTTCWRMLFSQGKLQKGESVLVVGAGGGVNSLAISMASAAGAKVFALTSTSEKEKKAKELGAEHVINYRDDPRWHVGILKATQGRGIDLVVDNVGKSTISNSLKAVARGGRVITVGNTSGPELSFDNRLLFTKQISLIGSTMGSKQDFQNAQEFILKHKIVPAIDRVEPLKNGIEMIKRLEEGKQFGKIILKP